MPSDLVSKLNNNSWIKVKEVSIEDLSKLSGYDMVFVNGMGLRIVEEQRAQLRKIAEKGIPIYTLILQDVLLRTAS